MRLIFYTPEIASVVLKVPNDQKEVVWEEVILGLSDVIKKNYNGKNLKSYQGDWKIKIKIVVKELGCKLVKENEEYFDILKLENDSISKSTKSNYKLSDSEKKCVLDSYDDISTSCKWTLSTGKVVDDIIRQLTEDSIYEHPAYSMILDTGDLFGKSFSRKLN